MVLQIEPKQVHIQGEDECRRSFKCELVQNDECKNGQVWPLVRCAQLRGPWEILRRGCVFVELPGTGDSNTVRNCILTVSASGNGSGRQSSKHTWVLPAMVGAHIDDSVFHFLDRAKSLTLCRRLRFCYWLRKIAWKWYASLDYIGRSKSCNNF